MVDAGMYWMDPGPEPSEDTRIIDVRDAQGPQRLWVTYQKGMGFYYSDLFPPLYPDPGVLNYGETYLVRWVPDYNRVEFHVITNQHADDPHGR